jgi:hypothetical protein
MSNNKIKIHPNNLREIQRLALAHTHADIRSDCAINRRKQAIERGDADEAIMADTEMRELLADLEASHKEMWGFIHSAYPETTQHSHWSVNHVDGVLAEKDESDDIISGLAKAFAKRGGH